MIETITHTTAEATKNGIALRELTTEQSVALCLVYLAKGYEYKLGNTDDELILSCAEKALEYDNNNLNAMLLKAEVLERGLLARGNTPEEVKDPKAFEKYEQWLTYI